MAKGPRPTGHQCFLTQDHRSSGDVVTSAWCKRLLLLLILVNHGDVDLLHRVPPFCLRLIRASSGEKKSRRGRTPSGIRPPRLTRQRAPRTSRVALHLVFRRLEFNLIVRAEYQSAPASSDV